MSEGKPLTGKGMIRTLEKDISYRKNALFIIVLLSILAIASTLCLLLPYEKESRYIAEIYQDGTLVANIPLAEVEEPFSFIIKGSGGCTNEVEVRPDGISIIAADCPDKLCVNQGMISDSRLPITCLPNKVVIQLRPISPEEPAAPDIITY